MINHPYAFIALMTINCLGGPIAAAIITIPLALISRPPILKTNFPRTHDEIITIASAALVIVSQLVPSEYDATKCNNAFLSTQWVYFFYFIIFGVFSHLFIGIFSGRRLAVKANLSESLISNNAYFYSVTCGASLLLGLSIWFGRDAFYATCMTKYKVAQFTGLFGVQTTLTLYLFILRATYAEKQRRRRI